MRRLLAPIRRAVVATSRGPLEPVWRALYALAARAAAVWLARPGGAGVYLRGRRELEAGVSDVDLSVIARTPADARAVRARYARLLAAVEPLGRPVECFHFETAEAVAAAARTSVLTHGLGDPGAGPSILMQERPVIAGQVRGWRRLAGPDLLPPDPGPWPEGQRPGIAWLDIQFWWRHAFAVVTEPPAAWIPLSAVKLVAEPARTLAWLRGEPHDGTRARVLERAVVSHPWLRAGLEHALELQAELPRSPRPDLALVLNALRDLSLSVAREMAARAPGHVEVRLEGDFDPAAPPLLDWRARVMEDAPADVLSPRAGSVCDPAAMARAVLEWRPGFLPAVPDGDLLVLPARDVGERLRGVLCPAFDPVTFALMAGQRVARFPELAGLSAADCAWRAVAEHAHRKSEGVGRRRAELFLDSVRRGEPVLCVSDAAVRGSS